MLQEFQEEKANLHWSVHLGKKSSSEVEADGDGGVAGRSLARSLAIEGTLMSGPDDGGAQHEPLERTSSIER